MSPYYIDTFVGLIIVVATFTIPSIISQLKSWRVDIEVEHTKQEELRLKQLELEVQLKGQPKEAVEEQGWQYLPPQGR